MSEADSTAPPPESIWQRDDIFKIVLTPEIIRVCFLVILGRPASDEDITAHLSARNVGDLRRILFLSEEFRLDKAPAPPAVSRPSLENARAEKVVFVHLYKTGGTTLSEHLRACFPPEQVCADRDDALHAKSAGHLATCRLFFGHYCLQSCDLIPGPKRMVTMLRHPVSRLVSLYYFWRAHSDALIQLRDLPMHRLARRHRMADFFSLEEVRRSAIFNNAMVTLLGRSPIYDHGEQEILLDENFEGALWLEAAKANLAGFAAFGLTERFDESVTMIFQALNLPRPAVIRTENVLEKIAGRAHGIERLELEPLSEEIQVALAPLVKSDLELYRFGETLFQERATNAG